MEFKKRKMLIKLTRGPRNTVMQRQKFIIFKNVEKVIEKAKEKTEQ
jgi:hypothetical protein